MDKISIIIPCYNIERYIDRCLNSIEAQTYGIENLELIVIDDASTDSTYEHLLEFEKKHPENVLVVSCGENSGPGTVRNIGMQYATGSYISFVDADDAIDRTMMERLHDEAKRCDADIAGCSYKSFAKDEEMFLEKRDNDFFLQINSPWERGRFVLNSFRTAVWGRLYKKSFLRDNRLYFPENMIYGEDNFFSGLAMLLCRSYCHIGDTFYYYFQNENGLIQRNGDNRRIEQLTDIMKMYIGEVDARGLLDEIAAGYFDEFEWYMVYKYFMDPASFVISRKMPEWREKVRHFRAELLRFFPEAYNNIYLNSDRKWTGYVELLKDSN